MKIYFCWLKDVEEFNSNRHCIDQVQLLHLEIRQREGEVAVARLHLSAESMGETDKSGSWAWISVDFKDQIIPLFLGRRCASLSYAQENVTVITLEAIPTNWKDQVKESLEPWFKDPSPFCGEQSTDPMEFMPCTWHFDPVTHDVRLNDLFMGTSSLIIDREIIKNSFHQNLAFYPFDEVEGEVVGEWVQELEGVINIYPMIRQLFEGEMVNTLTPQSLLDAWPKEGTWIKRSGYVITKSHLEIIPPPSTGNLNIYPSLTKTVLIDDKPYRFRRYWLAGLLELSWRYRQKRRQKVVFTLIHDHQHTGQGRDRIKKICLNVPVEKMGTFKNSMASFFDTSEGEKIIFQALSHGRCHLAASARNIRFKWRMPFTPNVGVTQNIRFKHPYENRWIDGKLIEFLHGFHWQGWFTELIVATTPGVNEGPSSLPDYLDMEAQNELQGLKPEIDLSPTDFVEHIQIINPVREQISVLEERRSGLVPPTQINFVLKDLRSHRCLEQTLRVTTPLRWSGPCQMQESY